MSLSAFDKGIEVLCIILLIILWGLSIANYLLSPEIVAIHFDLKGKPDGHGSKWMLLVLPCIPTLLYFAMGFINKYPHHLNYPVTITVSNAKKQYGIATRMIRLVKLSVILVFTIEVLFSLLITLGISKGLGIFFLPLTLLLLFIPVFYGINRALKDKKINAIKELVILESVITCPVCGAKELEVMPTDACLFFYECKNCHERLRPREGDCCVFCSYGSVKCPSKQTGKSCG